MRKIPFCLKLAIEMTEYYFQIRNSTAIGLWYEVRWHFTFSRKFYYWAMNLKTPIDSLGVNATCYSITFYPNCFNKGEGRICFSLWKHYNISGTIQPIQMNPIWFGRGFHDFSKDIKLWTVWFTADKLKVTYFHSLMGKSNVMVLFSW